MTCKKKFTKLFNPITARNFEMGCILSNQNPEAIYNVLWITANVSHIADRKNQIKPRNLELKTFILGGKSVFPRNALI